MSTRFLLATLLAFTLVPEVRAGLTEAARAFDAGNEHYQVGNYRAAVDAYEEAMEEGYASAALFLNMGNAFYRMDELGEAIRSYERALLLAPDDPVIIHNLDIARGRTVDQFSRLPVPFWRQAWIASTRAVGAWGLFAAGIVFWIAAAVIMLRRTLMDWRSEWSRRLLTISAILGAVLVLASFAASLESRWNRSGVVLAREAELHAEPSENASTEVTVHEGVVVDVLQTKSNWMLVRLPNGVRGWTPSDVVGIINL